MKKRIIFYSLISVFLLVRPAFAKQPDFPQLLFFYSQGCHFCQKAEHEVMQGIEKAFFDKIIIEYLDIADVNNYKLMLSLKEKYNCYKEGVPTVFIEGKILVGYDQIKAELKEAILAALRKGEFEKLDRPTGIDLAKRFLSFGVFAIITAGLIDGINPCAFTVIVFFISFLAFQGYRKKELLIIGISFICAVFFAYVLIGLGIFRFLYSLSKFYLVTKIIYYSIAALCFILGILALYDLWIFKKTRKTEGLTLQLTQSIKNRIQAIIGLHYRKSKDERIQGVSQKQIVRLIGSAFITGFLISVLEAVCTGQLYLPTITFVLKDTNLRLQAFGYLLLYNLMFVAPLMAVLIFALLGTTSEEFSKFVKSHMITLKLSMALLFFGLGFLILMRA